MPPLVSIILPAYNAAPTIARAIESIRAQTFTSWELIVIDDGSTDGTATVVARCIDPRVRLVRRNHDGLVAALNEGIADSCGALIARMDADDESHPERLGVQVALLQRDSEIGLVSCLVEFGGDANGSAGYALHVDWINSLQTPAEIALNRFVESPFAHPSVMFRRSAVDQFGGYADGEFPEDYELWLRWLDAGVVMTKVPQRLVRWHDSPSRLSRTDPRYSSDAFFRIKAKWIARELTRVGRGREIWIWGAGRPTRKRAAYLESHGIAIAGYIDIDPKKTTPALGGRRQPVISPSTLPSPTDAFILAYVSSRGARDLIRTALVAARFTEGHDFLLCA